MSQQPSASRAPVVLAVLFLVLAAVAFAVSVYLYDGVGYAQALVGRAVTWVSDPHSEQRVVPREPEVAEPDLVLPKDMSDAFAIRLWQEQVDSQAMIERLISGSVKSLRIDKVSETDTAAELDVTVTFVDGSAHPGVIGMEKYDGNWYVAHATGKRSEDDTGMVTSLGSDRAEASSTPFPDPEDVDYALLSTVIDQQKQSSKVIAEYVNGYVKEIVVMDVKAGPNTVTLYVQMNETHGSAAAKIVAIRSGRRSQPAWFLARFTKTGADHADPK